MIEETLRLVLGLAQVALALLLLRVNFTHLGNRALALFLLMRGTMQSAQGMVAAGLPASEVVAVLAPYAQIGRIVAAVYLVSVFPVRRRFVPDGMRGEWPFLGALLLLWTVFAVSPTGVRVALPEVVYFAYALTVAGFALVLARSFVRSEGRETAGLLVALGLLLIEAFDTALRAWGVLLPPRDGSGLGWVAAVAHFCIVLAVIAVLMRHRRLRAARAGGYVLLAAVGSAIGCVLLFPLVPDLVRVAAPALTLLWDVSLPVLVGYALLQHQLFGFDGKVRFAISRSTIAAVFIAVFFVASEAAQQFFGETIGGTYAGIAAAGALVFALAPLQRAAERLAEKAVPVVGSQGPAQGGVRGGRVEELYRNALRVALRDRALSRDEEVHLHKLAEELGIGAGRAHELLAEVEREAGRPQA